MLPRVGLAFVVVGMFAATVRAAERPPSDRPPIDRWLAALSDPEPAVRGEARERLMGLTPADLPSLHAALTVRLLTTARPTPTAMPPTMPPALEASVRDVVTYVLTRAAVGRLPSQGEAMLGVQLGLSAGDLRGVVPDGGPSSGGVPVVGRLPGFGAYRYLQSGDLIVAFVDDDALRGVTAKSDVQHFVAQHHPGDAVVLRVQRVDRLLTLRIPLDRRPRDPAAPQAAANQEIAEIDLNQRLAEAARQGEAEFTRKFGSLVADPKAGRGGD